MAKIPDYKREFKYTNEVGENEVYMLLGLPIGNDGRKEPYIIGAIFAEEMYFWHSVGYKICVKINCPGGSIMDGFSIMDAIRETKARTQGVGIIASMAMPILLTGYLRSAYDYSKGMIHPPKGTDKMAVEMMRDSLQTILTKLSDYPKSKIEEMLSDGAKDTWLDAEEMKKRGLIEEIIPTEMSMEGEETDPYAAYKVYNTLIQKEMAKEKEEPAGFDAVKAIADVQAKLDAHIATITAKDTEIATLTGKLKAIEDAEKLAKENAGKLKVENAIKEKKLTVPADKPELKDQFVRMAIDTPQAFEALIGASKTTERKSVITHMTVEGSETTNEGEETYEYLANNNPKKLYDMMDNDPDKYKKLVNRHYEKAQKSKVA